MTQYLFQAWNARGPSKYRDMLLETGTEEIGHVEMLATAVAMNLEGAPMTTVEEAAKDPAVGAVLGGMNPRHVLSSGLGAMAVDSNGVPFNGSWAVGSGNLAADMYANVMAESTGRTLAVRLFNMTDDPGMKDMLRFLIARDTMHQEQWLAVLEELGGLKNHPIPNSFPQEEELQDYNYVFLGFKKDGSEPPQGRWSSGQSLDGRGEFSSRVMEPQGQEPKLAPPKPGTGAQKEQMAEQGLVGKAVTTAKEILE